MSITKTIPVAEFRRRVGHLERIVHVDYHACVGADELRGWLLTAQRVRLEVERVQCRRTHADDLSRREAALEASAQRIARAGELLQSAAEHAQAVQVIQLRQALPQTGGAFR